MFMGEYHQKIDEKGRLTIPSKLRYDLGENFILTRGLDGCLFIYPKNEFEKKISEKEKEIIDILSKACFNHIMILEKDLNEYILIYYFYDKNQNNIEEEISFESESKNILHINNYI